MNRRLESTRSLSTVIGQSILKKFAYVKAHKRLAGVDGDVERVIFIRQMTPLASNAVSVPQFKTPECGRVQLQAYLVNEHVWR